MFVGLTPASELIPTPPLTLVEAVIDREPLPFVD